MRKHGKQAILQDDEIERIETKGIGIISDMYGKRDPAPKPPEYTEQQKHLMSIKSAEIALAARSLSRKGQDIYWLHIFSLLYYISQSKLE